MLAPKVQIIIDEILLLPPYSHLHGFQSFINAMCMRNRTMRITTLEDWLFVNLLIVDCLYTEIGGAGWGSVDRERCSYELTLVVVAAASFESDVPAAQVR